MDATKPREPRLLGSRERLSGEPQVSAWKPRTRKEVEALPPLPSPPPRPQLMPQRGAEISQPPEPTAAQPAAGQPEAVAPPRTRPPRPNWLEEGSTKGLVWDRPEDAAKLLRTMLMESKIGDELMQKAGIVVLALGQEVAAEMLKFLTDYELEQVSQTVASLKGVSSEALQDTLEDFRQHLQAGEWATVGGMDYARGTLERVVGPRKAREIMDRVSSFLSSGFYVLKNVAPEQVAPFISHEHPQTIALILSQLEPAQAAGILSQFPERMQPDVSYRMATMENVPPGVFKEVEASLEASLRDVLGGNLDVGGPKVVADILNLTGSSVEKNVLDQMDAQDSDVSESIKNLMFVWADVGKFRNRELQVFMQEVDDRDLVIGLKTTEEEMKQRLLSQVSAEKREFLIQEIETLGPMRLSEVEEVQLRLVQVVRRLEGEGKIAIVRGDIDDSFV